MAWNVGGAGAWGGLANASQNALGVGMNLIQMRQQQEEAAAQQQMELMKFAETMNQHQIANKTAALQLEETRRQRATAEQTQKLEQQKFYAANPEMQPWDTSTYMGMETALRLNGVPVDDLMFMEDLKGYAANPQMNRGAVANAVGEKWPEWKAQTRDSLSKKNALLSDKASQLPENDPKRRELIAQIQKIQDTMQKIESIPDDKARAVFFPDIYKKEQKEQFDQWSKNQTKEQLMARALRGDKEASNILAGLKEYDTKVASAGAPRTTVNVIGEKGMGEANKALATDLVESRKTAESAAVSLNTIRQGQELVKSGVIAGSGSQYLTSFGNFLNSRLGIKYAEDPIKNTQIYGATMAKQTAENIKMFGSGTGLSDQDRKYAARMSAADPSEFTPEALKEILRISEKQAMYVVNRHNEKAKQAMSKPGADQLLYDLTVKVPGITPSAGGPAIGTVQGGYKFLGGNPAMKSSWQKVR